MTTEPKQLPAEIETKIDGFVQQFLAAKDAGDDAAMESAVRSAWAAFPEPQFGWPRSQVIVQPLMRLLCDNGKAAEALALSDEQIASGTILDYESDPWMHRASTLLALGRTEEAHSVLREVLDKFGKRAFAGHDARLLTFAETAEAPEDMTGGSTPDHVVPDEIDDEVYQQIVVLSEAGDARQLAADLPGAVASWRSALELVPEPKTMWEASAWLYGSIGDVLTDMALASSQGPERQELLAESQAALIAALDCPGGDANPLVLMRHGQVSLELADESAGREFLLRAYMLEGEAVFEGEDPKYLDLLRSLGDI